MGNALNLDDFFAVGLQAQNYVLTHILVWNMLLQLIVVGCLYLLARLAAGPVRPWLHRQLKRHPLVEHSLPHLTRVITTRLVSPIITVALLWFTLRAASHFHWPNHGIRIFLSLFLAWVIIRLLTSQIKNRTLARGISVIFWSVAALDIVHLLHPFLALLNSIDLTISNVHLTLLSVLEGGFLLVALFWLAKKISVFFEHWIKTVEHITPSAQVLLHKLLTFALFTLVALGVLYYLGFNLTALAVFSGAIGLGLGFGLQKIFSNLISGLIILADRSIKPGDVIQLGDTHGYINYLGSRYVSVVTRDATEYLIPNEDLVTNQVINWSYSNNLVRLKIPVGIGYDSDVQQAMDLMLEAAAEVDRILTDPKPACLLIGFGENSVDFQLRVWIHDPQNGVHNVKSQILLGVWKRFQQHGIDLPLPQRVLHHQSVPELEVAVRPRERDAALNPTG
ncbi:MAG: mechanosensitive ion channel [Proteobacteria bacterium]|nr:mechanosensitive ion channel [Pseudomonadota bacterium]MBU4355665.1 mechanosensitive ion channel [Pseudomonadota bacterium]MBU4448922.1 mechanosensitive ion channel [Pseudomonadota bacterium]MCG2770538.1 mechanosensitive ion channel [Desulfobacterales bacterium]